MVLAVACFESTGMAVNGRRSRNRARRVSVLPLVPHRHVPASRIRRPDVNVGSPGYAHNYSPAEYIDAWIAVNAPKSWTEENTTELKAAYANFNPSPI